MRNLLNIRIPSPSAFLNKDELWWIQLDNKEHISSLKPMPMNSVIEGEDWKGDWISPRGVDLQINGGLGISFNDLNFQQLPKLFELLDLLWDDGIEAIAPTLITCSVESLRKSLKVLRLARREVSNNRCKLLGAHLEGPFLAEQFRGVHNSNFLCQPSLSALDIRINDFEREITLVTLAPELLGTSGVIKKLKELEILVALGHSGADSDQSRNAFNLGISMLTHTFNAMPGIHHREPGPIGEALVHGDIGIGLIADGIHVHPKISVMLQKLALQNIFLVSDALPPYGLNTNNFEWDQKLLFIENGVCRLKDGTLAGTTLSLLEGSKRLANWTRNPSIAIWSATVSPRIILKSGKTIEEFLVGQSFKSLLRWNFNFESNVLNWIPAK